MNARRWIGCLVVGIAMLIAGSALAADPPLVSHPSAAAALQMLREGKAKECAAQLAEAAKSDPALAPSAEAAAKFANRLAALDTDHRRQSTEALEKAKTLIATEPDKARDELLTAWRASADRDALERDEAFVDLSKQLQTKAAQLAEADRWLDALKLYLALSQFNPADAKLRDATNDAKRRVQFLALYAPEALGTPDTATPWPERLKGARMDTTAEAMAKIADGYFQDVSVRDMSSAGVAALKALVGTKGIDKAFDNPITPEQRDAFAAKLDAALASMKDAGADDKAIRTFLGDLESANRDTVKLPDEVLAAEFFEGVTSALDPFTAIIWPTELADLMKSSQGTFSGVGIQIQSDDQSRIRVVSPIEGGPAYKAGIKAGDVILAADGKSVTGMTTSQATKLITGPVGSGVTLTVLHPNDVQEEFKLTRQSIKVAAVKGWMRKPGGAWNYLVDPQQKIAYVRINSFNPSAVDELNNAIAEMRGAGARAMLIDVRYNPGGSTKAGTEICDRFLGGGTILDRRGSAKAGQMPPPVTARAQDDDVALPVVVLINEYSANCSEILAGSLQDNGRAVVVGARSSGKADEQLQFPLAGKTAYLRMTASHFLLPSGRDFQRGPASKRWGVEPDVAVLVTQDEMTKHIELRQSMEVLRDEGPGAGAIVSQQDLREEDPQLAAALLVARLQLAGEK